MKNYIKIFAPFALAIIIGTLTFSFAQTGKTNSGDGKFGDRREGRMPPREGLNPRVLEQLNLTDAQKEQIQAVETAARGASKENFEKLRGYEEQLRATVESSTFNEEQARQILNSKAQAQIEMEIIRLRAQAAVLKILTTEQKARLEQLKQQRPELPRGGFRGAERSQN